MRARIVSEPIVHTNEQEPGYRPSWATSRPDGIRRHAQASSQLSSATIYEQKQLDSTSPTRAHRVTGQAVYSLPPLPPQPRHEPSVASAWTSWWKGDGSGIAKSENLESSADSFVRDLRRDL